MVNLRKLYVRILLPNKYTITSMISNSPNFLDLVTTSTNFKSHFTTNRFCVACSSLEKPFNTTVRRRRRVLPFRSAQLLYIRSFTEGSTMQAEECPALENERKTAGGKDKTSVEKQRHQRVRTEERQKKSVAIFALLTRNLT